MNIPIANFISRKKKEKEKRGGHMIKCLLTELGRAGRENIWPSVMAHGPRCARSVSHDLGPNIFPFGPPTQSISTYSLTSNTICNLITFSYCNSIERFLSYRLRFPQP